MNAQYVFGLSVNGSGEVAGNYGDNNTGNQYGFTYVNGTYTALTGPNSNDTGVEVSAINASGEVVGYYTDDQFMRFGYTYRTHTGQYTTVAGPSGATNLQINAVNESRRTRWLLLRRVRGSGRLRRQEWRFYHSDGAQQSRKTSIRTVFDDSGEIVASYWDATTPDRRKFPKPPSPVSGREPALARRAARLRSRICRSATSSAPPPAICARSAGSAIVPSMQPGIRLRAMSGRCALPPMRSAKGCRAAISG